MGKYFGTDGVRGKANEKLTMEMAVKIGQFLGWHYGLEHHGRILIGKDPRLSSDMFEMGLACGASAAGANVYLIGICPTPAISYLIRKENFDCGIMVSASHNPFYDNGIKLFAKDGCKMSVDIENQIESFIDDEIEVPLAHDEWIGSVIEWKDGLQLYESWLKSCVHIDLSNMKILLDLANGSACSCAVQTLSDMNASVEVIHGAPNGININTACGSTHPELLQQMMQEGKYDVGFAFDGDADRLIAVDEEGNILNGDGIMYICAVFLKENRRLKDNKLVTTVMSNLGLYKALEAQNIEFVQTDVGDKFVFECMKEHGYTLGGEQSGHIIFQDHATTGDGLLTALKLLKIMRLKNEGLKKLREPLFIYPQLLVNTVVQDKAKAMEDAGLKKLIARMAKDLGDEGRILVRESGTESLIRVMVEAKSDELCEKYVTEVVNYLKSKGI